jgi:uncharacterized glyoxalase superfamily protein PhnB
MLCRPLFFVFAAGMKSLVFVAALLFAACSRHEFPAPAASQAPGPPLTTEIFVSDLKVSRAFYERLGFTTAHTEPTFAELQFGGQKLFLSQRKNNPRPTQPGANLRIPVPDVDRYWALAREMKAEVLTPIGDRFYKERDFMIADPDGFGLRFASLLPGGKW